MIGKTNKNQHNTGTTNCRLGFLFPSLSFYKLLTSAAAAGDICLNFPNFHLIVFNYRKFKISENFPILNKDSVVKKESDSPENDIKARENSLSDKSSDEKSDNLVSSNSENKKELDKENSTDCFDFDNEDFLDKDTTYKANKKSSKKQFTKGFKCDLCDKKYTWYTGLSNHKRFVHNNKTKET